MSFRLRCFVQLHITVEPHCKETCGCDFQPDQVPHNLMYAAAEDRLMLQISHRESREIVQSVKQKQKVFISCGVTPQLICAFVFSHAKTGSPIHSYKRFYYFCFVLFIIYDVFSSPELLGSQCELIVYPSSRRPSVGVRCSASVRPSTISKIFSSETACTIKAKFYVKNPWEGEPKFV